MSAPWFQVAAVLLLISFLLWKQYRREHEYRSESDRGMKGRGFETATIKAHLDRLQARQQPAPNLRKRHTPAHEQFATNVRKSLLQLSFFKAFNEKQPTGNAAPPESGKRNSDS